MQRSLLLAFLSLFSVALCQTNPAIEREFNRVVNSNECLKECMAPIKESEMELSIFKRSNFTDYLLNLDTVCTLITDARQCVDACRIESNPFALLSVNAICSEKLRQDAKLLMPCLKMQGARVQEDCNQICGGDYEQITDEIRIRTSSMKPNDREAAGRLIEQTNSACAVMKCSSRCVADNLNRRCEPIKEQLAGDMLRELVESILRLHRVDLEVFHLLDAIKQTTPNECIYLYTPDALFSPLRDAISQSMIRRSKEQSVSVMEMPRQNETPQLKPIAEEQQPDSQSLANQLYVKILKKQLQVLNKQLSLLSKQEQKMETPQNEMPRFMQKPPRFYANDLF